MNSLTSDQGFVRTTSSPPGDWHQALRTAVRDPAELCRILSLPTALAAKATAAQRQFPLFAPLQYIAKMRPGNPLDPLLRQVMPLEDELRPIGGYCQDPVGDSRARRSAGLLQKYRTRVLMITTGVCAVHCRYCFRRHYPYQEEPRSSTEWAAAIRELAKDQTVEEVILSGGDPLTLVDQRLEELVQMLAAVPHLRRIRVHTRLPIVIPSRVTDSLLSWLTGTRLTPIVVVHANHAHELGPDVAASLAALVDAGVPTLNQTVLLRGVNDDLESLTALSQRLIDCRVMPYYLHQLDRVAGAAHFDTPAELGPRLIASMRARLPGYAVPRLVREVAGAQSKEVLA